jgi:glycosyltransferase involved in cell wall biosynthesis
MRVLHVTGGMDRGGVETWLMHVLRARDPGELQMDFLSHRHAPAAYDDEIRARGSRIFPVDSARSPVRYARDLRRILREHGPFDAVHSHVHHFSGYVLGVAARERVPARVAHAHVSLRSPDGVPRARRSPWRVVYEEAMRRQIWRRATAGLANSDSSGRDLFGSRWGVDRRFTLVPYGFDFSAYESLPPRARLKEDLGLDPATKVLGHVGRFHHQKNHPFLIRTFRELSTRRGDVHLLLVGGRGNIDEVRESIHSMGLADRCTITGETPEVARHVGAMDLMVFPSLFEGLGIVVLEAQAAGVPVIASPAVPPEADVVPELVTRVPLEEGEPAWVEAILARLDEPAYPRDEAAAAMIGSQYSIENCLRNLMSAYRAADR